MKLEWRLSNSSSIQIINCKFKRSLTCNISSPRITFHPFRRQPRLLLSHLLDVNLAENDIAIIKLKSPESLSCQENIVWPACLPEDEEEEEEEEEEKYVNGLISGWGKLGDQLASSRLLRAASVPIVTSAECNTNVEIN